jgi:hypothetical protein
VATGTLGDYIAMLPAPHSIVAGTAQSELYRLDDAGKLPVSMLRQVSDVLLARPEKTLVRAQLSWLEAAALRSAPAAPSPDARELVLAMATAFGQQAAVLQRQALTLTIRHAALLDATARAELAEAAYVLPADLRADAEKAFGGGLALPALPPSALLPSMPARALPPPIGSAAELAAEITSLYQRLADPVDPVALERVLAGVVETSAADRVTLAAALRRLLANEPWIVPGQPVSVPEEPMYWRPSEYDELNAIVAMAVAPPVRPAGSAYPTAGEVPGEAAWRARLAAMAPPDPSHWLVRRLHEIAVGLGYAPRPLLLSTPTTVSGLIDPAVLVDRMRRAADDGWEPWRLDLAQALARLPRAPQPGLAEDARTLGTGAALLLARRLAAGGPPGPVVTRELRAVRVNGPYGTPGGYLIEDKLLAVIRPASAGGGADPCVLAGKFTAHEECWRSYPGVWQSCWPAILPAHRDIIAAHLVPYLGAVTVKGQLRVPVLPLLAQADGPVGTGMNLALAYGLGARDKADRAAAVDALITLAARGACHDAVGLNGAGLDRAGLDGAALGESAGTLAARGAPYLDPLAGKRGSTQLITQVRRLREAARLTT